MKKYIQKIKDSINKSWNNKTSKSKRLIIYGLLLAYMGFALYVIFMPAPDYRYEEYVRSEPPATNLIIEEEAAPADKPIVIPQNVPNTPNVDTKEGICSIQRLLVVKCPCFF